MIPVMRPRLPSQALVAPWLDRMDASGTYSNFGPLVQELERAYADFLNVAPEQVVTVASATLGLEGAVKLSPPEEWHVPDFTFPASALAVLEAGKRLVLADVAPDTWQLPAPMDGHAASAVGYMPVLPFGAPIDLAAWAKVKHVVIDAAASLGSVNTDLGGLPSTWAVVFSLHATKVLPAGEGGLVVFGSRERAKEFRAWSNFGFAGTRVSTIMGTNAKMSEISAAYALASLSGWEVERAEWIVALAAAQQRNAAMGLSSIVDAHGGAHPYWIVQLSSEEQLAAAELALTSADIQSRRWWPAPLHEMPAFHRYAPSGGTPQAQWLARTVLGLPMYRGISPADLDAVVHHLAAIL